MGSPLTSRCSERERPGPCHRGRPGQANEFVRVEKQSKFKHANSTRSVAAERSVEFIENRENVVLLGGNRRFSHICIRRVIRASPSESVGVQLNAPLLRVGA